MEPTDTPEDRDADLKLLARHSTLIENYKDATLADLLADMYFLTQLAMFKQQRETMLANIHHERGSANCICRTNGCGHRADQHPNGMCVICNKLCWS